jgi:hypothetical protein
MPVARRSAILLLALAASAATAAPVPKELKAKKGDFFPTAVGSRWEFVVDGTDTLDHVREVTAEEVEKDGTRTVDFVWTSHAGSYGRDTTYRVDATGVARLGFGKGNRFQVPYLMFKADAKPGESWDAGISLGGRAENVCTRGAAETVTTPAGKFEAVPVTFGTTAKHTYWYAAGVGLVKWKNGNKVIVLSKYTAGKEAKK